jgi:CRP-like cAMP-binding protein
VADELRDIDLLAGVTTAGVDRLLRASTVVQVNAGETVVRRWDSDRDFYVALSGRFSVEVDGSTVTTIEAGGFFGELAARDWGAGYGYARLATVTCLQVGRLLRVPHDAFQSALASEPVLRRRVDAAAAERLERRR